MNYLIKNAHVIIIHVPITMLIFSFFFDLISKLLKKHDWNIAGLLCLVVGALGAIAAVLTGPNPWKNPIWPEHRLFGTITMYFAVSLSLVRLFFLFLAKIDIGNRWAYLPFSLIVALLVSFTGHLGGSMDHPDRSKTTSPTPALTTQAPVTNN